MRILLDIKTMSKQRQSLHQFMIRQTVEIAMNQQLMSQSPIPCNCPPLTVGGLKAVI